MTEQDRPAPSRDRLEIVDVLRGFALMGLFLVHMLESFELYWSDPRPGPITDTVFLLLMGKSFSLLALCFGFSFYILMERAAQRGSDFTARFAWRLLVLFAIGTLHALVYRGDIIQILALTGFVLLALHRVRDNRVIAVTAAVLLTGPVLIARLIGTLNGADWASGSPNHWVDPSMQIYVSGSLADHLSANLWQGQLPKWWFMIETGRLLQILGLYLIGMVLGRIGFFARLGEFARGRRVALAVAAGLAVFLHYSREPFAQLLAQHGHGEDVLRAARYLLASWGDLAGTACWGLLLIALWQRAPALLRPLAAPGRLTLTFYIAQSLLFVPVFYGFGLGLWDDWSAGTRLGVGLAAVAGQVGLAGWWLRRFHYGPLEWLWRAFTFLRFDVPLRRR